ncbi:hypothetical protein [Streptomyces sp. M41(2017)]|uniref:hypothetical protein n=1 Tax=Streptomyces sp. M41(2017) TaxID=1955065 RepID=UPI0015C42B71|nr:hypothetical protein [Streptomyces sp. M41(2017)]
MPHTLGVRPGSTFHERAHGDNTTAVDPAPTPVSRSSRHRFDRDEPTPPSTDAQS